MQACAPAARYVKGGASAVVRSDDPGMGRLGASLYNVHLRGEVVSELPPPQRVAEVQAAIDEIVSGDAHQLVGAYYHTEAGGLLFTFLVPLPLPS